MPKSKLKIFPSSAVHAALRAIADEEAVASTKLSNLFTHGSDIESAKNKSQLDTYDVKEPIKQQRNGNESLDSN